MKNLYIFEDYISKPSTKLLDYNKNVSTFQGFFLTDNNNEIKEIIYI